MIKFYISLTACVFFVLASCSSHKKRMTDRTKTDTFSIVNRAMDVSDSKNPYHNVNYQLELFQKHIFFYASNSAENWELFIKKDSSFTFELNGTKTVFEFSKGVREATGIRYHSKKVIETTDTTQKKSITILLSEQDVERVSINYSPFNVNITVVDQTISTTYSGSGFFVSNPALNDIWVLDSLNNEKVDVTKFPQGLPRLEFHLNNGSIYGFSGCNEIAGGYYIIRNKINISMAKRNAIKRCTEMSGETAFLSILNKVSFAYSIDNLRLTLLHNDKTRLVFKKVD